MNGSKSATNTDYGVTDKFQQAGKFADTESVNKENLLYIKFYQQKFKS